LAKNQMGLSVTKNHGEDSLRKAIMEYVAGDNE